MNVSVQGELAMTKQRKAGVLAFIVGIAFVGLQVGLEVQTGLAGLFVSGMAGGLVVGDVMARDAKEAKP
jgi:hypothetical protein